MTTTRRLISAAATAAVLAATSQSGGCEVTPAPAAKPAPAVEPGDTCHISMHSPTGMYLEPGINLNARKIITSAISVYCELPPTELQINFEIQRLNAPGTEGKEATWTTVTARRINDIPGPEPTIYYNTATCFPDTYRVYIGVVGIGTPPEAGGTGEPFAKGYYGRVTGMVC